LKHIKLDKYGLHAVNDVKAYRSSSYQHMNLNFQRLFAMARTGTNNV